MKTQKEGFPNQILVRLPLESIRRMKDLPICSSIFVTDIGKYPEADHHLVKRPKGSENHILIYCVNGTGWINVGKQKVILTENLAVLIPAHTSHSYGTLENNSWSIYWLHFNGTEADRVVQQLFGEEGKYVIFLPRPSSILTAFNEAIRWSFSMDSITSLIALSASCIHLLGLIISGRRPLAHKARAAEERISQSVALIKNTLNQPLTLPELASEARLSVPHFTSLFKKQTGLSPIRMYTRMRVQMACNLLDNSNLPIFAVAEECGYSDPFYFSRNFRRIVGCSPTQYRNKSPNYHGHLSQPQ